jgi:hypothetical protein
MTEQNFLYTNALFWKKDRQFLSATETEMIKRLEDEVETFEVLHDPDFKYKMYLDIDIKLKSPDEFDEDKCEWVEMYGAEYIETCVQGLMPNFAPKIAIATSHSKSYIDFKSKKEATKISVRFWITNLRATKRQQDLFVMGMNKFVHSKKKNEDIWKYIEKCPDLFDKGIYDSNRKMRCVGTSKPNENRPLKLKEGELKDTLISGCFADDVVDFIELDDTTPPKKASKTETKTEEDLETQSVASSNETVETDCVKIREVFEAIIELNPTRFDQYAEWAQLGFLINNQTNGHDDGCELFLELSNMRDAPQIISANTASKQFNATQKGRKKEDKLHIASLYKWLEELDPNHPLVLEGQEKRLMSGEMRAEEIRLTKNYQEYRVKFQKTNFKLNNPVRYCELINDKKKGKYIIVRSVQEFLERNRDIDGMPIYLIKGGMGAVPKKFHELWLDDCVKLKYSQIKFDPTDTEEELEEGQDLMYNAFCGWVNDKCAEPIKKDDSAYITLMKWLLVEDKVFEYYMCWLAHIIQQPQIKTKVAPILYSKTHGTGKNSLVDGSIAIIGKQLSACVECIEDITKNFNAHLCNKLFIYGDEICANAKKVADKLKAVITRPTTNLEKKGIDAIEVDDLTNWIFTSNNENNIKVEEGDRRFLMVRCREEKQHLLSKAMYEEIGDPDKLAQLFAFFKTYEQSEESIKKYGKFNIGSENVIETEYKKQMIYEHRSAYIQILYKSTRDLVGTKYSASKLYEFIQEWAKKHYCSANFTIQEFSKHSQKYIGGFKKPSNTGTKYVFPDTKLELLKHLYNVDEPYYRYVNQLEDNYTPTFKAEDPKPLQKDHYGNIIWNSNQEEE